MKKIIIAALLTIVIIATITARPLESGIAWDLGGIDNEGFFLCPGSATFDGAGNIIHYWENPLAPMFPELVTDC